jgi:carboxyl-terminal processing protease
VRRLLGELKREKVEGLVLDLRGNGGGHLSEATALTGLFTGQGPVVQVRYSNGKIDVEEEPSQGVAYSGPLVVLVDRFSASASEIFAAAIQDYRRGVVIGQQTFGKGTVQNLYVLDQYAPRSTPEPGLGQLTLTIGKFYRVTGGSTQHRGVIPDIVLPSAIDAGLVGESSRDRALPWDQIAATRYTAQQPLDAAIGALVRYQTAQLSGEPDFRFLRAELAAADELRAQRTVSLNMAARKAEREQLRQAQLARENTRRKARGLPVLDSLDKLKAEDQPDVLKDASAELALQLARAGSAGGPVLTRAEAAAATP